MSGLSNQNFKTFIGRDFCKLKLEQKDSKKLLNL